MKWFLWHGNVFRALRTVDCIIMDLETLNPGEEPGKLLTAMREFDSYIRANAGRIPNYGAGEAISTAFVESTVNQVISKRMVKKQQMRWTPRGPPTRSDPHPSLNDQLTEDFHRWYPNFTRAPDTPATALAAWFP